MEQSDGSRWTYKMVSWRGRYHQPRSEDLLRPSDELHDVEFQHGPLFGSENTAMGWRSRHQMLLYWKLEPDTDGYIPAGKKESEIFCREECTPWRARRNPTAAEPEPSCTCYIVLLAEVRSSQCCFSVSALRSFFYLKTLHNSN